MIQVGFTNAGAFVGIGAGTADETGVRINELTGALLLTAEGVALDVSGSAAIVGVDGLSFDGELSALVNTTGRSFEETVSTPAGDVTLLFPDISLVKRVEGSLALDVAGFVTLDGAFVIKRTVVQDGPVTVSKLTVAATNVQAFAGSNGAGLQITDANIGLVIYKSIDTAAAEGSSAPATYALTGAADAALVGIPSLTLQGALSTQINTTGGAVNERIQTAEGEVRIRFNAAEGNLQRFVGSGLVLGVNGVAEITADLVVERTTVNGASRLLIAASSIEAYMGLGTRGIQITNGSLAVIILPAGTVGLQASGTASLVGFDGVTITGNLALSLNTTGQNISETLGAVQLDLAAGLPLQFLGTNLALSAYGNSLSIGELSITRQPTLFRLSGTDLDFTLRAGPKRIAQISDADFTFVLTPDGLVGAATNAVLTGPDLGADISLTGTVSLFLNATTTARAVTVGGKTISVAGAAQAGSPYLRLEILNGSLVLFGNVLAADRFVLEKQLGKVSVNGTNLDLILSAGTQRVIGIEDADFAFTFTETGVAGAVVGGNISGPDFGDTLGLSGDVSVRFNTMNVDQILNVGGTFLVVDAAAFGGRFLQVELTNGELVVLGQRLTGTFRFEQNGSAIRVEGENIVLKLGDGTADIVTATIDEAAFEISTAGLLGGFTGSVIVAIPGVSIAADFEIEMSTHASDRYIRLSAEGLTIEVAGQMFSTDLILEQYFTVDGDAVVRAAFANLSLRIKDDQQTYVDITHGQGFLLMNSQGIAGSFSVAANLTVPGASLTAGSILLEVNTMSVTVDEFLVVGTEEIEVFLPPGPYLRVVVLDAELQLGNAQGPMITADFSFSQYETAPGVPVTQIAVANAAVTFDGQGITQGEGAFVLLPTGVAGYLSGVASIEVPGVSLGGSFGLEINKSGVAVNETLQLGDETLNIVFPTGDDVFRFFGADLTLNIGGFVTIEGEAISFSAGSFSGTGVRVFLGQGPALLPDDTVNPSATGVLLSNVDIGIRELSAGQYAIYGTGAIQLLGVPNVTIGGTATDRSRSNRYPAGKRCTNYCSQHRLTHGG
jgi:hypothetical protein